MKAWWKNRCPMHAVIIVDNATLVCALIEIQRKPFLAVLRCLECIDANFFHGVINNPLALYNFFKTVLAARAVKRVECAVVITASSGILQETSFCGPIESFVLTDAHITRSSLWAWNYTSLYRQSSRDYIYIVGLQLSCVIQIILSLSALPILVTLVTSQAMILAYNIQKKNEKLFNDIGASLLQGDTIISAETFLRSDAQAQDLFIPLCHKAYADQNPGIIETIKGIIAREVTRVL